jgi:hypothetical protein
MAAFVLCLSLRLGEDVIRCVAATGKDSHRCGYWRVS